MGVKRKNTGFGEGLEKIFEDNTSDRASIKEQAQLEAAAASLSGASSAALSSVAAPATKERKKKARLTAEERRNMHPVQTFLNEDEWTELKIKLAKEKILQEQFIYDAVMKAIRG